MHIWGAITTHTTPNSVSHVLQIGSQDAIQQMHPTFQLTVLRIGYASLSLPHENAEERTHMHQKISLQHIV